MLITIFLIDSFVSSRYAVEVDQRPTVKRSYQLSEEKECTKKEFNAQKEIVAFLNQKLGTWATISNASFPSPVIQRYGANSNDLDDYYLQWSANRLKPLCSSQEDKTIDDPVNERSVCPWSWKKNYDPRRLPSLLFEADCVCNQTASVRSTNSNGCGEYECEPVVYQFRVLRFDTTCKFYKMAVENIAVACVPVVKASHEMIRGVQIELSSEWTPIPI